MLCGLEVGVYYLLVIVTLVEVIVMCEERLNEYVVYNLESSFYAG